MMFRLNFSSVLCSVLMMTLCTCCNKYDDKPALEGWENLGKEEPDDPDNPDNPDDGPYFRMRGLVLGWSEVSNPSVIDYVKIARENGINTFSIYGAPRTTQIWTDFQKKCADAGIDLEYEEHMMSFLLPRDLFDTHPEYFRMDENGNRTKDANGCPSSEGALEQVRKNAREIGLNYEPTNDKYYFWLDDGGDICHCPKCKGLNASDQALIFENEVIKSLKTINPKAKLAHLCYFNTLYAPEVTEPHPDIFLEFAPFYRTWAEPLANTWAKGNNGLSHADYLRALKENLEVFPAETAQVLEYWMDDSLFSGWDPNNLVEVPWKSEVFLSDIATYASYGIRDITCYAAYVGPSYVLKFGYPNFLAEYGQGLLNYEKK
ncbi:MAG: DUF4838 domain-containing protein [Candidatus Cryptobacteroides sp.]|nr:DUF4838 domain-containing protein [Candidatus Cryptobacteroides sp.]